MNYKIMKFAANRNYEGKEIEVQKISKGGNKTAIQLILELTKEFRDFVKDQNSRWAKQEKFNADQRKFNAKQEKHNAETDEKLNFIFEQFKKHKWIK